MTEWLGFVKNQLRLQGGGMVGPKLICINLQPYTTRQALDRGDISPSPFYRSRVK